MEQIIKGKTWHILLKASGVIMVFAYGVLSTRVGIPTEICGKYPSVSEVVMAPDVEYPLRYGLLSGITLGRWPVSGYGVPEACSEVDAGEGIPLHVFLMIRMRAAYTWAVGRGIGFVLSVSLLVWGLLWLWRGAQHLANSLRTP